MRVSVEIMYKRLLCIGVGIVFPVVAWAASDHPLLAGSDDPPWMGPDDRPMLSPGHPEGRPPLGPGGPVGPMRQKRELVKQFDKDGDGHLNTEERQAARQFLKNEVPTGRERHGPGPAGRTGHPRGLGGREDRAPATAGPRVSPADVKSYPNASFYDPTVLRTLFLEFEDADWEDELADFHDTDVEVPATLTVDGRKYPGVGVHFRGMSSYMMVPAGYKRSLGLSLDFIDSKQRLYGYKTLNLLNAHGDPSFIRAPLYSYIARQYIPAPKANLVKLVINGESWGIYPNVQQFNKEFVAEHYEVTRGTRWKVRGSPNGDGGLAYIGETIAAYEQRYEMKSNDGEKAWRELIQLCRILGDTPTDQLEEALQSVLDIDGALWFLALDVTLINNDGYWVRASDYGIFRENTGLFHIIPYDMNEALQGAMHFGMGGPGDRREVAGDRPRSVQGSLRQRFRQDAGRRGHPAMRSPGPQVELDPLVAMDDSRKPLRSRLLAVPGLRTRYLQHVRTIAEEWLDWGKLGPVVRQYRLLMDKEIQADTRKLTSYEAFQNAVADMPEASIQSSGHPPTMALRTFADERRKYLLNHPEIRKVK